MTRITELRELVGEIDQLEVQVSQQRHRAISAEDQRDRAIGDLSVANAELQRLKAPRFTVWDATRFPGAPALNLPRLHFAYANELHPVDNWAGAPDLDYVRDVFVPRLPANLQMLVIDKENWVREGSPIEPRHIDWFVSLITTIKAARPGLKVALYGVLAQRDLNHLTGTAAVNATRLANWRARNDALKPIADVVDFFVPSCYLTLGSTRVTDPALRVRYHNDMCVETRRIAQGKPVYPALWIAWSADHADTIDYATWRACLEQMATLADGVTIWSMARGSPPFDRRVGWYEATTDVLLRHAR